MSGEELTRFPITPEERHRTARSSDDIEARPEEQSPGGTEAQPQDKPVVPIPQQQAAGDAGPDPDDEDQPSARRAPHGEDPDDEDPGDETGSSS
jgi:hypothetical protein